MIISGRFSSTVSPQVGSTDHLQRRKKDNEHQDFAPRETNCRTQIMTTTNHDHTDHDFSPHGTNNCRTTRGCSYCIFFFHKKTHSQVYLGSPMHTSQILETKSKILTSSASARSFSACAETKTAALILLYLLFS